jgi:hypothetical protein
MDTTSNEFEGTELDPTVDYDFEDFYDETNDLLPIIGASAAVAAVAGAVLLLAGRRHKDTPQERIQEIISQVEKSGKKGAKAIGSAVDDAHLSDLLSEAIAKARRASGDAAGAVQGAKLADTLDEALTRTRRALTRLDVMDAVGGLSKDAQKGLKRNMKKASRNLDSLHLDEAVGDAVKKARRAASNVDLADAVDTARKRAGDLAGNVRDIDIKRDDAISLLETLKERLTQVVETVREDLAPKAIDAAQGAYSNVSDTVRKDVLPAAQDAVDRVRDDVLPAASDRVSQFVDDNELDRKAGKAASAVKSGAGSLSDLVRGLSVAIMHKAMDELLPDAKKAGKRAATTAREEVIPAAAHGIGQAAQKVQDDVLPKVGELASQAPDVVGDMLKMARDRVDDLLHAAEPVASDALDAAKKGMGSAADRAGDAAVYAKHRAEDLAGGLRQGKGNVTGAVSSVGTGVRGAVGGAVDATAHATREMTGILFWLSMLGGLILLVFIPNREKQQELWNGTTQFLSELREMWRDLQGTDVEELPASSENS